MLKYHSLVHQIIDPCGYLSMCLNQICDFSHFGLLFRTPQFLPWSTRLRVGLLFPGVSSCLMFFSIPYLDPSRFRNRPLSARSFFRFGPMIDFLAAQLRPKIGWSAKLPLKTANIYERRNARLLSLFGKRIWIKPIASHIAYMWRRIELKLSRFW